MISLYDKLIDNLSHYAVPYEDHPQQSTRDFEYDHPLTGIENDRIVNIDNSSFNIDTIEDLSFDEIQKIHDKLAIASPLTTMREYDEESQQELFTYYKGKKNQYIVYIWYVWYCTYLRHCVRFCYSTWVQ